MVNVLFLNIVENNSILPSFLIQIHDLFIYFLNFVRINYFIIYYEKLRIESIENKIFQRTIIFKILFVISDIKFLI